MGGGAQAFGGVKMGGGVGVSTPPVFERPPRVSGKNTCSGVHLFAWGMETPDVVTQAQEQARCF
jgi:hypothetical protein